MSSFIKMIWQVKCIKILFLTIFNLCLIFSPLVYTQSTYIDPNSNIPNSIGKKDESLHHKTSYPTLSILPEKETFKTLEIIQSLFRCFRYSQRLLSGGLKVLVISLFTLELALLTLLSSYRITNKHISMIAISLGGHAPPIT